MKQIIIIVCLVIGMTASAQDNKTKVFVTTAGAKYHLSDSCQYVRNSPSKKAVTLEQAKKDNKTLCKRCEAKAKKAKQK